MGSFSYTSCVGFFICGGSVAHPVLASLFGEFFLHILCWFLYVVSFLTHPVLASLYGDFFLHILCWFLYLWRFYCTSRVGFFMWGVFLTYPVLVSLHGEFFLHILSVGFFIWGVFLTNPVLVSLYGEFFLHILCWFLYMGSFFLHILCWFLYMGSFSYTSCVGFFIWRVSLARPDGDGHYKCGVSLTRSVPCWLLYVGNFYNTSTAGFFMWGVSLTHLVLASLCRKFFLQFHAGFFTDVRNFYYTSNAGFLLWEVSLTLTSRAGFFMRGVPLIHLPLASVHGEFLLHIPC